MSLCIVGFDVTLSNHKYQRMNKDRYRVNEILMFENGLEIYKTLEQRNVL